MASSQIMKERRVYYLDCSYSMKQNGLWDVVRKNLKTAIDNVSDETTELIVIPFAFDCQHSPTLEPIISYATISGKEMIKSRIDNIPMSTNTMTYHYVPIEDFYRNRVAEDRITYMFLMTDGQDEDRQKRTLKNLLPQWGKKYGDKNVFGFYVMLCDLANNDNISRIVETQEHLWTVKTADVNINLVRLRDNLVFNVRNEHEIFMPLEYGSIRNCPIELSETKCNESFYEVDCVKKEEGKVVAKIRANGDLSQLPEETQMLIYLKPVLPSKDNGFTCLVNNKISVKCKNKKERTLKFEIR